MGQNRQSHLCYNLDNTSPRLAFTSTSTAAPGCSIPRLEELFPVSPCSCPPRGPQLFHSQVNFTHKNVLAKALSTFTRKSAHSQDRACKCTCDFHSKVTSPLKNVLANAQVTFSQKSTSPFKNVLANAPLTFTRKSTHSQDRAFKCTGDFHSQVTSPLSSSHSGRLATVARLSFVTQSSWSCELDTVIRCHTSCCAGRPLWAGFCFVAQYLLRYCDTSY